MALVFDKYNKIITVESPQVILIIQDLHDDIRLYEEKNQNLEIAKIADASGKEDLGGGVNVGITLRLLDNWRVKFEDRAGPSTVSVSITGGNLVGGLNGNPIAPSAFTQVAVTSSSSATISTMEITHLKYMIEAQRETHQGFGESFYVDPTNGDDTNNTGILPTSPLKTVTQALVSCVTGRGDVIYLLAPGETVVTANEAIVISKEDVHLRGPGRGVQIQPTSGVPITINANSVSLSGFIVRAPTGSTATDCIVVNNKASKMEKLYVYGTETGTGCGVVFRGGDYHELYEMEIEKMGGDGIKFIDDGNANGSPREVSIIGGNIYLNKGSGINLTGTSSNSTRLNRIDGCRINDNTNYGILVGANAQRTVIEEDVFVFDNGLGDVQDNGTYTTDLRTRTAISSVKYLIESGRRHHAGFGQIVFWNPTLGSDTYAGETPSRAKATYAACEALITDPEGGTIFLLGGASGDTTVTERINITKEKIRLRGPGKSVILKPADTTAPTLTINAGNCYVSGVRVQTATGSAADGVYVSGDWTVIEDVYIESATGKGINIYGGSHHEILGVDITSCGQDGIYIKDADCVRISTSKSGAPNRIQRCTGNGITIDSTSSSVRSKDVMIEQTMTHHNGPYEIENKQYSSMTIIRKTVYVSPWLNGAAILDSGSGSHNELTEIAATADTAAIADAVWDELMAGHITADSAAKILKDAKTRATLASLK